MFFRLELAGCSQLFLVGDGAWLQGFYHQVYWLIYFNDSCLCLQCHLIILSRLYLAVKCLHPSVFCYLRELKAAWRLVHSWPFRALTTLWNLFVETSCALLSALPSILSRTEAAVEVSALTIRVMIDLRDLHNDSLILKGGLVSAFDRHEAFLLQPKFLFLRWWWLDNFFFYRNYPSARDAVVCEYVNFLQRIQNHLVHGNNIKLCHPIIFNWIVLFKSDHRRATGLPEFKRNCWFNITLTLLVFAILHRCLGHKFVVAEQTLAFKAARALVSWTLGPPVEVLVVDNHVLFHVDEVELLLRALHVLSTLRLEWLQSIVSD